MGVAEIITAIWQSEESKKINEANGERPEYVVPEEYKNILTDAQLQAAEGLPAAQKQQYIENVVRGQSQAMQGVSSRKGGLTGLVDLNQQGDDAYKSLLSMDANARAQNRGALANARQLVGNSQETAFFTNELNPWKENDSYAKQLTGAAFQNFSTGVSDIKNTVLGMFSPSGGQDTPQAQAPQMAQGTMEYEQRPPQPQVYQQSQPWGEDYSFDTSWT